MGSDQKVEIFGEEEIARRRGDALKRMLTTPHQPCKPIKASSKSPSKRGLSKKQDK